MKIVLRDIYGIKADKLICDSITQTMGKKIVRMLNEDNSQYGIYYQLVSSEYELKEGK